MSVLAASIDHAPNVSLRARDRLRAATAEAHAELDTQFSSFNLSRRDDYVRFLAANAAALLPIERALEHAGVRRLMTDWDERRRSNTILADLDRLGGTAKPLVWNAGLTRARMLGTLYVLEGSRLGARFLVQSVMRSHDPVVRDATAYLRHGEGRRLWPSFLSLLEHEARDDDVTEMTAGATAAFAFFAEAAARE